MQADNLTVLAVIFGGGGIVSGAIALWKVPSDKNKVVVDTSQGAVVVLKGVLDELKLENKRLRDACDAHEETIKSKDKVIASLEHIITIIDDRHTEERRGAEERRDAGRQKLLPPSPEQEK